MIPGGCARHDLQACRGSPCGIKHRKRVSLGIEGINQRVRRPASCACTTLPRRTPAARKVSSSGRSPA